MIEYDPSYKRPFSHPQMVEDLLRGFVRESWVENIDFSTLETVQYLRQLSIFHERL